MVHAVAVVTVDEPSVGGLLLWQGYTGEWNLPRGTALKRVTLLCARVHADVRLRLATDDSFFLSGRVGPQSASASATSQQASASSLQPPSQSPLAAGGPLPRISVPEGVLRLSAASLDLPAAVVAVWRVVPQFAAAVCVVLQRGESLAMAQHTLAALSKAFLEQTSAAASSATQQGNKPPLLLRKEIFETRPDEALVLLEHYLPAGLLLVLGPSYAKHLRKEADALMASK